MFMFFHAVFFPQGSGKQHQHSAKQKESKQSHKTVYVILQILYM